MKVSFQLSGEDGIEDGIDMLINVVRNMDLEGLNLVFFFWGMVKTRCKVTPHSHGYRPDTHHWMP